MSFPLSSQILTQWLRALALGSDWVQILVLLLLNYATRNMINLLVLWFHHWQNEANSSYASQDRRAWAGTQRTVIIITISIMFLQCTAAIIISLKSRDFNCENPNFQFLAAIFHVSENCLHPLLPTPCFRVMLNEGKQKKGRKGMHNDHYDHRNNSGEMSYTHTHTSSCQASESQQWLTKLGVIFSFTETRYQSGEYHLRFKLFWVNSLNGGRRAGKWKWPLRGVLACRNRTLSCRGHTAVKHCTDHATCSERPHQLYGVRCYPRFAD